MIIKDFVKIGMKMCLIGIILIALIFQRIDYMFAYFLGYLASNINLFINDKLYDISGGKVNYLKFIISHLTRMLVYTAVLIFTLKIFGISGMIIAFVGCLTIRVSILIYGIKGGIMDGYFK